MTRWFDSTLHPEWYHGGDRRPPYFEGWYYKMVSPDRQQRYAVIPGVFLSDDPARHHAFIQVFDGMSGHATYHRYPADAFDARDGAFDIRIGNSRFLRDRLILDIDDDLARVQGEVHFGAGKGWPVRLQEPGVMGWFGWLPVMECYHGILSFDHTVDGALAVGSHTIDFSGGRGYIEKDWGQSFPAGWLWMQTNHFSRPGVSLTASIAIVPSPLGWFPGFLCGIWDNGRLTRFATYTGARTHQLEIDDEHVFWALGDGRHRVEITATRAGGAILPGPTRLDMGARVPETLRASIHVCLMRAGEPLPLLDETGECAGLEVAGDVDRLLAAV